MMTCPVAENFLICISARYATFFQFPFHTGYGSFLTTPGKNIPTGPMGNYHQYLIGGHALYIGKETPIPIKRQKNYWVGSQK
jgi:hypothetical protein